MLRGAIFDLDGTLLASMHVWKNFDGEYLKRKGIVPCENLRERIAPLTLPQAAELFQREYGVTDSIDAIMNDVNALVEDEYYYKVQPKRGIPEMLRAFADAGVKMCVATATDRYLVEAALRRTGLDGYFGRIFTSTEVGTSKCEPETFELARQYLGTSKEDTYVFEDALYAVQAAKRFGYTVVAIDDIYSDIYSEKIRAAADIYLSDITRWRDVIKLP